MQETLQNKVDWAVAEYHHGRPLVLLFDYDGTLTEFTDRPSLARLPPDLHCALEAVSRLPRVTVGIISGRELDDLKNMVNLPGLFYAGTSGLEIEYQGEVVRHPLIAHSTRMVNEVAEALDVALCEFPGGWVERKHFGLTVHYREVDPDLVPVLHEDLDQRLVLWNERLHVVTGAKAVEITPNLGWTKGTAVEFLLEHLGQKECLVMYAGDEASDVEALWNVGIHQGIAIGVGHSPCTTAEYNLADAHAVQHLLEDLGHALGCGGSPHSCETA